MSTSEEVLRRLTIADPAFCRTVIAGRERPYDSLDHRTVALLRLGALIAVGSAGPTWRQCVDDALAAGLGFDDMVAALIVLAPAIGVERLVVVAPQLAHALGYDVDAALEELAVPATVLGT